jgi:hypothetical protein
MQELKKHAHWNSAIAPMLALHEVRVLKTWAGSARLVQSRRSWRLHALLPAEPPSGRLGRHAAAYLGGACEVTVRVKVVKKPKRGERDEFYK